MNNWNKKKRSTESEPMFKQIKSNPKWEWPCHTMRRDEYMKAANMYAREWLKLVTNVIQKQRACVQRQMMNFNIIKSGAASAHQWNSLYQRYVVNEHYIHSCTHAHIHKQHTDRVKPRMCSLQFRAVRPLTQHFSTTTDEHMPNMVCACYLSLTCTRDIQSHSIDVFFSCVCVVSLL